MPLICQLDFLKMTVKVIDQGANVPKDHCEGLLHLRPPAIGVVKSAPANKEKEIKEKTANTLKLV